MRNWTLAGAATFIKIFISYGRSIREYIWFKHLFIVNLSKRKQKGHENITACLIKRIKFNTLNGKVKRNE